MRVRTAILVSCVLAGVALASNSSDETGSVGLSFDGLFKPTQTDWRVAKPLSDTVLVVESSEEESGLVVGYVWTDDQLAVSDLDLWLDENGSALEGLGLSVGRSTALRDGGIDGASQSIAGPTGASLAGYAEAHGEFDLYDISMRIGSLGTKRMGIDFVTGFRAVQARVGHTRSELTSAGDMQTTLDLARGVVTIPIIGTGVHWQPTESMRFSGSAATHTMSDSATFYDLSAEAEFKIRPNVGFVAGYQYVRSAMEVRNVPAELDEAGLFARIQIKF